LTNLINLTCQRSNSDKPTARHLHVTLTGQYNATDVVYFTFVALVKDGPTAMCATFHHLI